ncbi:MAG: arylformamidase [Pseudorhodobacter sp.]|nr:arylformamidase [Rhizobacter sp.]
MKSRSDKQIWDISPPINMASPLFPGDTAYSQIWTARITPDCPVNISAITLSPHTGAHADAPLHYGADQPAIGQLDLTPYLGPCRVIHALGCGALVHIEHLLHAAHDVPPRVLVRTCQTAPSAWSPEFSAFAPSTIQWLADRGVTLVGIDSQSVDPADSKSLASHHALLRLNLRVLENLVLDHIPEGDYELIALPLKLTTADASPVRAVLRAL